jgi:hypothetical protein
MKKITLAILMLFSTFSIASAELGINVGVSGQMGLFEASGHEIEDTEKSRQDDAAALIGYTSIFLEKKLGSLPISIGVDYVPDALESETQETGRFDQLLTNTITTVSQKISVDFEDLTTYYVAFNVGENFYVKAGTATVDVITKENLGTGASYGNTSLDGSMWGAGYHRGFDNGMFLRAEATVMEFDGTSLTSSTKGPDGLAAKTANQIVLDDLNGVSGKVSIGKSF